MFVPDPTLLRRRHIPPRRSHTRGTCFVKSWAGYVAPLRASVQCPLTLVGAMVTSLAGAIIMAGLLYVPER